MLTLEHVLTVLGSDRHCFPALLVLTLGISSLLDRKLSEQTTTSDPPGRDGFGAVGGTGGPADHVVRGTRHVPIELGDWVVIPGQYHFSIKFVFDRLSVPMAILSFTLSGTIGAFASRYMHREPVTTVSSCFTRCSYWAWWPRRWRERSRRCLPAGNWSACPRRCWWPFFRNGRPRPGTACGSGRFTGSRTPRCCWPRWPCITCAARETSTSCWVPVFGRRSCRALTSHQGLLVGLLVLVAAAGKSALVPFSGWLPRAMEGPTPSSAVFYGALSVHLGAFLLLRVSPLLDSSPLLSAVVALVGLTTAVFAYLAGSVQTDIKSALSFASLSQVGIIVTEIGLGFRYVALIHILGHACLRALQFVRAPTLLHDYHTMENAIGGHLPRGAGAGLDRLTEFRDWLYRLAL